MGHYDVAELLVAKGADVRASNPPLYATPLHQAAIQGHKAIAELLIAKGADVNGRDVHGVTPLHQATWWEQAAIADILMAKGAQVNARDGNGQTALDWAERKGSRTMAALLRKHGGVSGGVREKNPSPDRPIS